ncbi:MAG TPA: glycerol kinase GlpK [Acidimicrobiales bacterium]|nr:glycerol kinase GlpK [Acidimicrobiales bacterium]
MLRLVAVDAGTTSVRALATDLDGRVVDVAQRELTQHFPAPGWVEHDAGEILALVDETLEELAFRVHLAGDDVAVIGITNQRETTVAVDRADGRVLAPAIVWQDRRTAPACAELRDRGLEPLIRARTGLTLDPYFSATKMRWLLDSGLLDDAQDLGLCTIDSLVCWHLTGGPEGGVFATDASNASRTMLYDLDAAGWSDELCGLLGVPRGALAELHPSCGVLGRLPEELVPGLGGVVVAGILGDQQAALFGQRCTARGMVKATFGTGAFLLANAGEVRPHDVDGLVTTVAWDLGAHGPATFALEGAAFVAGAAIQWYRDELGLASSSREVGRLARSVEDANGAIFVPALTGLGSPWWDPDARGTLMGLSRGVTRAHVARAVVDSLGFQGRAMLDAMREGGEALAELRVDGGASTMDPLCQSLADGARLVVRRPRSVEATAVGAATVAGLAVGAVTLEGLDEAWEADARFDPQIAPALDAAYDAWLDAVRRVRALAAQPLRAT